MAWETRGGRKYYYRSHRVNGQVKKTYFGCGPVAMLASLTLAERQQRRLNEREQISLINGCLREMSAATSDFEAGCRLLTAAVLYPEGYHQVDGKWRRRRAAGQAADG